MNTHCVNCGCAIGDSKADKCSDCERDEKNNASKTPLLNHGGRVLIDWEGTPLVTYKGLHTHHIRHLAPSGERTGLCGAPLGLGCADQNHLCLQCIDHLPPADRIAEILAHRRELELKHKLKFAPEGSE